jgi:two-component system cell cycle response regulator CpdR
MARILLAAHDDVMRCYLSRALARQGHAVVPVADAQEALGHLLPGAFNILVCDTDMPGMGGLELARRAGAVIPGLRILFRRGFSATPLKEGALPRLDDEALETPFHLNRLADEIDNLIAA